MREQWSRRAVLASAIGGAGLLSGLARQGHDDARLEADVNVTDWRFNEHGVRDIWFEMQSQENRSIEPACICWGEKRQAQQPWEIVSGPMPLEPGGQAEYHLTAPIESPDVHLSGGRKSILFVYDSGRDVRANDVFVPTKSEVSSDG